MIVLARAAPGRAEELADWYDNRHIPDLLRVPGFVRAERTALRPLRAPDGVPGWDFMLVYELSGGDPMVAIAEAGRRIGSDQMPTSDALDSTATLTLVGDLATATEGA